jgi:3-phosphoshikimate 1-carboxyvinyltransferase
MKATIDKSEIRGTIIAPSSKSFTIRGLMCAALAKGESQIKHPLNSDDTEAAISVLSKIGITTVQNNVWLVNGGNLSRPNSDLFCCDSAATFRFMTAICSSVPGKCRLTAGPTLSKRPVDPLIQALRQLSISCSSQNGLPPVTVEGDGLTGGITELPGNISSQYVSALLFISPLAEKGVTIKLTSPLESKPYVLMTLDCLQSFGITVAFSERLDKFETLPQTYEPTEYEVEGDWSSASYFLALGAISGEITVNNLNPNSLQGDKMMINYLRDMGASIEIKHNALGMRKSRLKAIRADLSDCIDLLPTMAILAAKAEGTSKLTGIERARIKESNRVAAVREGLERMGIKTTEEQNELTIIGSKPRGAIIDSKNDHRIAMAFSILGSTVGNTIINKAECVSKTYPEFWDELKGTGGKIRIDG